MYQTLLAKIRAKMHEYIVHYYYYKINWMVISDCAGQDY